MVNTNENVLQVKLELYVLAGGEVDYIGKGIMILCGWEVTKYIICSLILVPLVEENTVF